MARTTKKKVRLDDLAGHGDPRALLDAQAFLSAARPLLGRLEADLRDRAAASPAVARALEEQHAREKQAERTAESFAGWSAALATQVAAAWLLSCVFVRTLEDRGLLRQVRIAGPGAADSQKLFFQLAPSLTERDYLLTVFRELAQHPAARDLFDAEHSLVWKLSPSAELAKELLALFRKPSAETPAFRFGQASTRFLGDLYQDLSEDVRKRYALLQTPDFIESFILDRTLEPAIDRFGLDDTTLIDPTCGSGHFLLGAFDRLFEHRLRAQPGLDRRVAAKLALDAVHGADINPYAVAIARFRLTLAFLDKAGFTRLSDAPALPLHLVVADSLLHNPQHAQTELAHLAGQSSSIWGGDVFALEDDAAARDVLHKQYAAVVGNPPYITEKDPAKREVYRRMYTSAAGKYALSAPFCERFFQLARARGLVGQITANSFMKREFGKKLIEEYLPTVNLELIVNTSGAFIPGHGTPTVLLFGTHEAASSSDVLGVLAKRGEPSTPDDPSKGLVWTSVAEHWHDVGFENDYISVARLERASLRKHPWSLGGGGASELKELLEERADKRLSDVAESVGIACVTGEDEVFLLPEDAARRLRVGRSRALVTGEYVRDWSLASAGEVVFPYDAELERLPSDALGNETRYLWPFRSVISRRKRFGVPMLDRGLAWYELQELYSDKLRTSLTIVFAFVATHNHFVLDRGGKVFNRSAPIIKLPADATEDDHLALLAYLNSSTAAFYFRQAGHSKGAQGVNEGHKSEEWEQFLEYSGALVESIPVPPDWRSLSSLGRDAVAAATDVTRMHQGVCVAADDLLDAATLQFNGALCRLVAIQERIDWRVYELFGLVSGSPPIGSEVRPGTRPFEWRLAREVTSWFTRNGYPVPHGEPAKELGEALRIIEAVPEVSLLEQPTFKHRWTLPDLAATRLREHRRVALDAIENEFTSTLPRTARSLAENLSNLQPPFERDLLEDEAVPYLATLRFSPTGLVKHAIWQECWTSQRAEDAGGEPSVTVPPRYKSEDYQRTTYWQLRGKLDVPRERFISYPGCESDEDGEPVFGWAGWDHLQRAQALAALYLKRKDGEGWAKDRLTPMLAGLLELIPWLQQWHNEPNDDFGGERMGNYFASFLDGECRLHGLSHDDLRAWRPAAKTRGKAKKAAARASSPEAEPADADAPPKPRKPRGRKKAKVESTGDVAEE